MYPVDSSCFVILLSPIALNKDLPQPALRTPEVAFRYLEENYFIYSLKNVLKHTYFSAFSSNSDPCPSLYSRDAQHTT